VPERKREPTPQEVVRLIEQLDRKGFQRVRDTRKRHWPDFRATAFERPPVKLLILREGDKWIVEMSLDDWEISEHVRFPLNVGRDEPPPAEPGSDAQAP
jgi:hypothetical protein